MMDPEQISSTLTLIAQGLLVLALPVVIAAAFQHYRVMTRQLDNKIGADRRVQLVNIVKLAVQVAEQAGILDNLVGPEKRQAAIDFAENYLKSRGVDLDVGMLADLVEQEVRLQIQTPTPPEAIYGTREALIARSIETAVLAAQQSGAAGAIADTVEAKKAHAIRIVREYLAQYKISLPDEMVSSLIDAQILRFVLAAKGQLPPTPTGGAG
jgi:hypothetical protein